MEPGLMPDPDGLKPMPDSRPFPVGPSTVAELWARRPPESLAVIDGDAQWTTRRLRAECDRVTRCLVELGARSERVAWVVGNDVRSIISLLATIQAGAMWVGVSARATDAERQRLVDDADVRFVFDDLPHGDPDVDVGPPPRAQAGAALAFTSGTTGRPKGVVHTQQQLLYPAAAAIETEGLDAESRIATPLPLSTLNILLLGPLTALACGGTAVLLRHTAPTRLAADIGRHGVTRLLVVPTVVHDLAAAAIDTAQLAGLDRMILGGAGIDHDRARAAERILGVPLVLSYGLSEAPTGVARMTLGDAGATPLPGIDIRADGDEITLAPERDGAWANTWQGTRGYWRDPAATAWLWREGRLHTGDAGTIDDDGRLLVSGRLSDMINRGGSTIAPAEVEAALLALDGVDDVAVFGVADERLGEVVAAAVVGTADPTELATAVRSILSGYKVPERWLPLDRLPRNANGKVDRAALRAQLD